MHLLDNLTEADCSRPVYFFIHYQTWEHNTSKTNKPILLQIGTSGLRAH